MDQTFVRYTGKFVISEVRQIGILLYLFSEVESQSFVFQNLKLCLF